MSDLTLTPDDRKVISDIAARLEKRQKFCRRSRWLVVAYVIFTLALVAHVGNSNSNLRSTLSLSPAALKIPKNAGPEATTTVLQTIVYHNDAEVMALRNEIYMMLSGLILMATGIVCFLYVFCWSLNAKRDRALAKLLRSVASSGSDSGDMGANAASDPTPTAP